MTTSVVLAIVVGIGSQYVPAGAVDALVARFHRLRLVAQGAVLAVSLMIIDSLGPTGVAPFIYYRF